MDVRKADYMVVTTGNKRLDRFFGFENCVHVPTPMCSQCFCQVIDEVHARRKRLPRPYSWDGYKYRNKLAEKDRPDCRTCVEDSHVSRCVDNKIFVPFEAFDRRETERMISNFGIILQEIEGLKQKGETIAKGTLKRILDKLVAMEERIQRVERKVGPITDKKWKKK